MIIDGYGIKEIEAKASATKEAEAIQALMTFGDAADKYKTEWVDIKWKNPENGWRPVRLHLLPKLKNTPLELIDVTMLRDDAFFKIPLLARCQVELSCKTTILMGFLGLRHPLENLD